MKKILFHSFTLNYGGASNALIDYARYNREILGNESAIIYDPSLLPGIPDFQSESVVVDKLKKHFTVETYTTATEANKIASGYDLVYTIRGGGIQDPIFESAPMAVHAVFQYYQPHGHRYAYVSEWLANKMSQQAGHYIPYVPHIVHLPKPNESARKTIRQQLNIPENAFVFGRHGGQGSFNLPFVHNAVHNVIHRLPDVYFIFLNTRHFYYHPNVRYLDPMHDPQDKSDFISACDAMIHARSNGESFGIAMSEFMQQGKPVLSWEGGEDQHHIQMLQGYDSLYSEHNVERRMMEFVERKHPSYKPIVEKFSPERVMAQFNQVFLS